MTVHDFFAVEITLGLIALAICIIWRWVFVINKRVDELQKRLNRDTTKT